MLDSRADHGLGDSFLRAFLELVGAEVPSLQESLNRKFIACDIALEEPYQLNGHRKDVDIQVDLIDDYSNPTRRIIVENKIKAGAANPKQLSDYYEAILEDDSSVANLTMVFLTPAVQTKALSAEYSGLTVRDGHAKTWLRWDGEDGVLAIIRSILKKEIRGEITPINEYMRHTLKAFIRHVESTVTPATTTDVRSYSDQGEVVDEVPLDLDGNPIRVVRRSSRQIQVLVDGEKVVAKPVLRRIISNYALSVPTEGLNTQRMGKQVIDELRARGISGQTD